MKTNQIFFKNSSLITLWPLLAVCLKPRRRISVLFHATHVRASESGLPWMKYYFPFTKMNISIVPLLYSDALSQYPYWIFNMPSFFSQCFSILMSVCPALDDFHLPQASLYHCSQSHCAIEWINCHQNFQWWNPGSFSGCIWKMVPLRK